MRQTKELSGEEKLNWLRLIRSENVGPKTFQSLIEKYKTAEKALASIPELAARGGKKQIKIASKEDVQKEIEQCDRLGIQIIASSEPSYPELLSIIYDPPPVIFVKGRVELMHKDCFGIVGTRNASANGCSLTRKLAQSLAEKGFIIVSGLARGIDAEAHKASLETGTIAVIAQGLNEFYPPEHRQLQEKIAETGALVGENPPGFQPLARHFPQRNRIIAGLSMGLLVVEATLKSGSLITAEYAVKEGREVFAIPGSPMDPRCKGTNHLIKNGATLTESAADIVEGLRLLKAAQLGERKEEFSTEEDIDVSAIREKLLAKLSYTPINIDQLARDMKYPIRWINQALLELELAGKIERSMGGKVSLLAENAGPEEIEQPGLFGIVARK